MKFHSHLNTAVRLIQQYNGKVPFANFLKVFFKENKKYGSNDRKNISELCYCFFRLGNSLSQQTIEEKLKAALFLCSETNPMLEFFNPEWNEWLQKNKSRDLRAKTDFIKTIYPGFNLKDIFSFHEELSGDIDKENYILSHLKQPDLFLRIRPGNDEEVFEKLQKLGWIYEFLRPSTIRLEPGTAIENALDLNRQVVIQDYSSQRVGEYFKDGYLSLRLPSGTSGVLPLTSLRTVWDCCAASGGKSIMAFDLIPNIELTVSDVRESILINLKKRFRQAGIKKYRSFVADLSQLITPSHAGKVREGYDLIIADVPCSGSGTWSRTPEQLVFFERQEIQRYNELQKKIVSNVIPALKKGGLLVYITCSVFKKENEEIAVFIKEEFNLQLEKMKLIKGYDQKADTMFVAAFSKPF